MIRPSQARPAFTMVEVLVVVAIIGVLVGLLLPAVQSARESARATSCKNNLMQLQLATQAYHSAFDVYPAGTVTERLPARMFPDGKDHGWLVQIRPFLDGGFEFSERWSPVHSSYNPRNWPLAMLGTPAMICPSNPLNHGSGVVPLSYAGVHDGLNEPIDTDSRGFFVANRFLRTRDIADGLSHTLQIGEIIVEPGSSFLWVSGNQSTLRSTALPINAYSAWKRMEIRGTAPLTRPYGGFSDPIRIDYQMVVDQLDDDDFAENEMAMAVTNAVTRLTLKDSDDVDVQLGREFWSPSQYHPTLASPQFPVPEIGPASERAMGFASTHQSKIHGAFADGRVVTIDRSIDAALFAQMGVRDDHLPRSRPLADQVP